MCIGKLQTLCLCPTNYGPTVMTAHSEQFGNETEQMYKVYEPTTTRLITGVILFFIIFFQGSLSSYLQLTTVRKVNINFKQS